MSALCLSLLHFSGLHIKRLDDWERHTLRDKKKGGREGVSYVGWGVRDGVYWGQGEKERRNLPAN